MSTELSIQRKTLFSTLLMGIALLGANFLFSVLVLAGHTSDVVMGVIYLVARIGILFWAGMWFGTRAGRGRTQTIGLVSLMAFVDQVIWKGAWIFFQMKSGVANDWAGIPAQNVAWGVFLGYFASLPVLILISLGAFEAGPALKRRA